MHTCHRSRGWSHPLQVFLPRLERRLQTGPKPSRGHCHSAHQFPVVAMSQKIAVLHHLYQIKLELFDRLQAGHRATGLKRSLPSLHNWVNCTCINVLHSLKSWCCCNVLTTLTEKKRKRKKEGTTRPFHHTSIPNYPNPKWKILKDPEHVRKWL